MKATRHNGRSGKHGTYDAKHNDRRFDVENSEHIDAERTKMNVYWDCYQGYSLQNDKDERARFTFTEIEKAYYVEKYSDHVDGQNERNRKARHYDRVKTIDAILENNKTCPEETLLQLGNMDGAVSADVLAQVSAEYFEEFNRRYGSHVHILDWALHLDEATPHIHERHVLGNKALSRDRLLLLIKKYQKELWEDKVHLTDCVPYRLIKQFVEKEGKDYIDRKNYGRFISYLNAFTKIDNQFFYNIIDADNPLERSVALNDEWKNFIMQNYAVIMGWLRFNKALFIQDRNPGVPGVMYKVAPETEEKHKSLKNARELWIATVEVTGRPLYEIYTGNELSIDEFDLDHFVPRSYVSNDELWNLTPMTKSLNSSKNNKLPERRFIKDFVEYKHFQRQRKDYYRAETVRQASRDLFSAEEIDPFEDLKDETYSMIEETIEEVESEPALKKVKKVVDAAGKAPVNRSLLVHIPRWIGAEEKKGTCHMLVNEERIKWVDDDEPTV